MTKILLTVAFLAVTAGCTKSRVETKAPPTTVLTIEASNKEAPPLVDDNIPVIQLKTSLATTVYFDSEVNTLATEVALGMLRKALKTGKEVYVVINSPGGSVFEGKRLTTFIEENGINTVCNGICASMGAHIHQAGKKRLMAQSGVLMFHPASAQAQGQVENMLSRVMLFKNMADRLDAKVAARSGIPYHEFKRRVAFEYWLMPADAVANHLTDGLVSIDTGNEESPLGQSVSEGVMAKIKKNGGLIFDTIPTTEPKVELFN